MTMSQPSTFMGFVNGYKASNIATNLSKYNFIINEINTYLKKIRTLSNKNKNYSLSEEIEKMILNLDNPSEEIQLKILILGESLKLALNLYKKIINDKNNQNLKELFLKIIYHYLELASITEDTKIREKAIEIGKIF